MTNITQEQISRLVAFSDRARRITESDALAAFTDQAFAAEFGHRLFTALKIDRANGVMRRLYSTNTAINPIGGTKPIESNEWGKQVIEEGRHFIGRNRSDLARVFPDHEQLFEIGCESVLNTPVLWKGVVIGSINILHAENRYTADMCGLSSLYSQYLAPIFLED